MTNVKRTAKMIRKTCMFCSGVSLFAFIIVSFLHLFNGDELSPTWSLLLRAFGYSSVGLVLLCGFGILKLSETKSTDDDGK